MEEIINVGIIGHGFVGQATGILGQSKLVKLFVYDIQPEKCIPLGNSMRDLTSLCEVIFICLPTPMKLSNGSCDLHLIEETVNTLRCELGYKKAIIVRSTVPPGTCQRLNVFHMPEYLTEKNWRDDFRRTQVWQLGVPLGNGIMHPIECVLKIQNILFECWDQMIIDSFTLQIDETSVTETAKYMRNAMLAVRVSLCNEFERFCQSEHIDYEAVRQLVTQDPRIGTAHTQVPGPDGKRGFGGTCLVKDAKAIMYEMRKHQLTPFILEATLRRNEQIDRPTHDWMEEGRTVSLL